MKALIAKQSFCHPSVGAVPAGHSFSAPDSVADQLVSDGLADAPAPAKKAEPKVEPRSKRGEAETP